MILQTVLMWLYRARDALTGDDSPVDELGEEQGQGLVEYALILVLVSVAVIALLTILGPTLSNMFRNIVDTVSSR